MRFYQSQQYNPQSLFVPDTTPWDLVFKVAEQQQQKYDKTQAEVNALDNLQVIGGLATPHFAKQINQGISKYKQAANNEMLKGNIAGVLYNINEVKKLLNSPEAIAATEDYKYNQHSAKAYQEVLNDPGAYAPWFNRENNQVVLAQDASTFNPFTYYSSVKSGDLFQEYHPQLAAVKAEINKQYHDAGYKIINDAEGNPVKYNIRTGERTELLNDKTFRNIINQFVTDEHIDKPFSQYVKNQKAWNKEYGRENLINDLVKTSAPFWYSREEELAPTMKEVDGDGDSGNGSKKSTSNSLRGIPVDSEQTNVASRVTVNKGDKLDSIVPKTVEDLNNAVQTSNDYDVLRSFAKQFNLTVDSKEALQKKFPNQFTNLTTNAAKNILVSLGMNPDVANEQAPILKEKLDLAAADRNDIETTKDIITKQVTNSNPRFKNLTDNNPEVIRARKAADEAGKQNEANILSAGMTSGVFPTYEQRQAAYKDGYDRSIKSNGIYGEYLTKLDNAINKHYAENNQYLEGFSLEGLNLDKKEIGKTISNNLIKDIEGLSLSETTGSKSNDALKAEIKELKGDYQVTPGDLLYDARDGKLKLTATIKPNEKDGSTKFTPFRVLVDADKMFLDSPNENPAYLGNEKWYQVNQVKHQIYSDIGKKLKDGVPVEAKNYNSIVTKNGVDNYTIYNSNTKEYAVARNFMELSKVLLSNKADINAAPTSGGGDEKKFLNSLFHQ